MFKISSLFKKHSPEPAPELLIKPIPESASKPKNVSTLVVQSYKTDGVSTWIRTCLGSVRDWAASNGYKYEFIDDRFFDYAPDWFRLRCNGSLQPVMDIAKLYLLKEKLDTDSFDRVMWVDADVAVFAPPALNVEGVAGYALADETWVAKDIGGKVMATRAVNNSIMLMSKHQVLLNYLIIASEEVMKRHPPGDIDSLIVGTKFLTRLASSMPLRVLTGTATFSPPVLLDIVNGGGEALNRLTRACNAPVGAANLCGSLCGNGAANGIDEAIMERVVELLFLSQGDVVNGMVKGR